MRDMAHNIRVLGQMTLTLTKDIYQNFIDKNFQVKYGIQESLIVKPQFSGIPKLPFFVTKLQIVE